MASILNLSLTDELRAFVDENSGDDTLYATPSEFMRDVLRQKKQRLEVAQIRNSIVEGFKDLIAGRTIEYQDRMRNVIKKLRTDNDY